MCYSAQVVQGARKLFRELGARLDYEQSEKLFLRRLEEPGLLISRGFEANFEQPANAAERRIKAAIDLHRARAAAALEKALFTQKTRLATAARSLRDKETKKAREEVRIATNKVDSIAARLNDLQSLEPKPRDERIFPMMYAGVVIREGADKLLTPMRYFCRPAGKPAFYDRKFPGLYNARRDNLEKFWSEQFGRHHALAVVDSFYENVALHAMQGRELQDGEEPRNVVLHFTPQPHRTMLVACLWSCCSDPGQPEVRGFAAITDEPPPAVAAAGHDRCIVDLRPENVEAWLAPTTRSLAELQALLSDRPAPAYRHEVLQAA
jgi:putative SOS response-associated peptidase YedK